MSVMSVWFIVFKSAVSLMILSVKMINPWLIIQGILKFLTKLYCCLFLYIFKFCSLLLYILGAPKLSA